MSQEDRLHDLRNMLLQIAPGSDLESFESLESTNGDDSLGMQFDVVGADDQESFGLETLGNLIKKGIESPIDLEEQEALEAIIHTRYRPAIDIQNDTFKTPPKPWGFLGEAQTKQRIENAIPSIGRIEVPNNPVIPFGGTGFVVGDGLLMTNRHVAEIFTSGIGRRQLAFKPGQIAGVDFRQEMNSDESLLLNVESVEMIHPYWDMALLKVVGLDSAAQRPLILSIKTPEELLEQNVVVIGYPAQDTRNDINLQNKIFRGSFNVKRLQPGKMMRRQEINSYGRKVPAATHDCSTLGGNSGSVVLNVDNGQVVALHFAGKYLKANFAVPSSDLATDAEVVGAGVRFAGTLPVSNVYPAIWKLADKGESAWQDTAPDTTAGTDSQAAATPHHSKGDANSATNFSSTTQPVVVIPSQVAQISSGSCVQFQVSLPIQIDFGTPAIQGSQLAAAVSAAASRDSDSSALAASNSPAPSVMVPTEAPLASFFLDSIGSSEFGWQAALSTALASKLAYGAEAMVEGTGVQSWKFDRCRLLQSANATCFVATKDTVALVSFKGTDEFRDWFINLDVIGTNRPGWGTVHNGFLKGFEGLRPLIEAELESSNAKEIVLTGHSLGGAMATIGAGVWAEQRNVRSVYTFGQPAVGKGEFPTNIKKHYSDSFFRFVNDDDVVPKIPPTYKHVGRLFHFDAKGDLQTTESLAEEVVTEARFIELKQVMIQGNDAESVFAGNESVGGMEFNEGIFPSVRDHSMDRYIEKINRQLNFT